MRAAVGVGSGAASILVDWFGFRGQLALHSVEIPGDFRSAVLAKRVIVKAADGVLFLRIRLCIAVVESMLGCPYLVSFDEINKIGRLLDILQKSMLE